LQQNDDSRKNYNSDSGDKKVEKINNKKNKTSGNTKLSQN